MQESGETYLETILVLSFQGEVRSVDVANALGYSKPSVSRAMSILRKERLITMDDGSIRLTSSGKVCAERIYERHCLITRFLMDTLGMSEADAAMDACRFEHDISDEAFERIKALFSGKRA